MPSRIALIHATPVAIEPITTAFRALWPESQTTNLLEDSLSHDLAASGRLTAEMHQRFCDLATYSARNGADAVLFTCSAFGPCIETARRVVSIPVLKPNEAMIDAAFAYGPRMLLLATFAPSIPSMTAEFHEESARRKITLDLDVQAVPDALTALQAGDAARHDALIAAAARRAEGHDVLILAQFSMARAAGAVAEIAKAPVLTSPASAVGRLKKLLTN